MTSKSGDEKLLKSDLSRPVSLPKSGETHFSEKWGNIICFLQQDFQGQNVSELEKILVGNLYP